MGQALVTDHNVSGRRTLGGTDKGHVATCPYDIHYLWAMPTLRLRYPCRVRFTHRFRYNFTQWSASPTLFSVGARCCVPGRRYCTWCRHLSCSQCFQVTYDGRYGHRARGNVPLRYPLLVGNAHPTAEISM